MKICGNIFVQQISVLAIKSCYYHLSFKIDIPQAFFSCISFKKLLHWFKVNVVTSNRGSLSWDCSVEKLSLNIQKIIHSITIHLWEFTTVYRIAMFRTAPLLLLYNILDLYRDLSQTQRTTERISTDSIILGVCTKAAEQHFLWRAFTCLRAWVSPRNNVLKLHFVCILQ